MTGSVPMIGGTGLLGYHTAGALLDSGYAVTSLSTGSGDPALRRVGGVLGCTPQWNFAR